MPEAIDDSTPTTTRRAMLAGLVAVAATPAAVSRRHRDQLFERDVDA
jgi:hypothetical protein